MHPKAVFMQTNMTKVSKWEVLIQSINQVGLSVEREIHGFAVKNEDLVFPYIILTLCLRGTARALYDMKEMTHSKNVMGLIMPGHIMHPIDCSDDYAYARIAVSVQMFEDLQLQTLSHDSEKYHYAPICTLTDEQAERMLVIVDQLAVIASYTEEELPHRYHTLLAQLAVGYDFLNLYRREQDKQWADNRHTALFSKFCELVVAHHAKSREVKYYAELLGLSPKHFTKVIRSVTNGMSPADWIEQYVITQAKRIIEAHPKQPLNQVAYQLGFFDPTSFYRYFKHATGMTAKEYAKSLR